MSTINGRIQQIIDELYSGNTRGFATTINANYQTIRNIVGERQSTPSSTILEDIINSIDYISSDWLLTGKGKMYKDSNTEVIVMDNPTAGVPYYENIDVTGGIATLFQDNKEIPTFYINYEHFNDCVAYVPVVGDSMYPKYASEEIIAVKRIFNLEVIQWGEAYLIVTNGNANDLRTVKLLHPHDDENKIILRASNPNFKGDTVINKEDIISLFLIKGKITHNQL